MMKVPKNHSHTSYIQVSCIAIIICALFCNQATVILFEESFGFYILQYDFFIVFYIL